MKLDALARFEGMEEHLPHVEAYLRRAADAIQQPREKPAVRRAFFQEHFQGVAQGTAELAQRLGRQDDAATAGAADPFDD